MAVKRNGRRMSAQYPVATQTWLDAAAAHARGPGRVAWGALTANAGGALGCGGFLAGGVSPLVDGEGAFEGGRSG
jgi:hypothetical protein